MISDKDEKMSPRAVFKADDLLLYVVTDRAWLGERSLYEQVEEALKGGATMVQLREKNIKEDEFLEEAVKLNGLCKKYNVPLIINDNVDIAIKSGAAGVHVGQDDMQAGQVRKLLGEDKIIGVTAKTVKQAVLAQKNGADYLGVGAVFHSPSKTEAVEITHAMLKDICRAVDIPVAAIGGISRDNVCQLSGSGISGIAVISAVFAEPDVRKAAEEMKNTARNIVGF